MKKEPQIFTRINVQDVPVGDKILDVLAQEEMSEAAIHEYVKELLAEAAKDVRNLGSKVVVISDEGDKFKVGLYPYAQANPKDYGREIIGVIEAQRFGGCNGAYEVRWVEAPHGWGPLLYDVAMEYATMSGGGLVSDRSNVSSDAARVWDYYYNNRSDVDYDQMDDYEGHLTPEDDSDDCGQEIVYKGEYDFKRQSWDEEYGDDESWEKTGKAILLRSPFSKNYQWGGYSVIDDLRNAGKLVML